MTVGGRGHTVLELERILVLIQVLMVLLEEKPGLYRPPQQLPRKFSTLLSAASAGGQLPRPS